MAAVETNRRKVAARLEREGWVNRGSGSHDEFTHPAKPGRIVSHAPGDIVSLHTASKDAG